MYSTIIERAKRFLQAQRKKSIWHRAVSMMAAVVVFVTTYMLILPAITMEKETYCGQENQPGHIHSTSCYEQRTDEIINEEAAAQPAVSLASGDTSVGLFSIEGIEEVTDPGLEDEDSAASSQNGAESESESESASETESESEIEIETSLYLCGLEEHEHEESCYTKDEKGEPVLICEKEEHVHDDSCLDKETESETATETETEKVETEIETETESDTEIGTEFSTSAETEQEAVTETETGAEVATETEGEIGTESESKAGTETVPETEAVSGTEMETEIVAETEDGDESELSTENETKAESLSETEQETESEVATEQKTESEVMTEQETESESDKESIISTDNSTADNNTVNNIEETDAGKLPNMTLPIPLIPRANSILALRTLNYSGLDIVPSTPIEEPGSGIGEGRKETEESDSESETEPETSAGSEQSETEPETITSAEESETESEAITGTEQSETESQTTQATEKAETELETTTESEELETESESTADSENYGELICHLEEHHHSDACYTASEDIASVSTANTANIANTADTKDAAAVNATDASAEQTPTCGLEEHVHDASCYAENDAQGANGEEEPGMGDVVAASGTGTDLSPYITGVTGTGTTYDKGTDYYNTDLRIEFAMEKAQVTAAGKKFSYNYPKGIVVPDKLLNTNYTVYDKDYGTNGFQYCFTKNADGTYSVTVEFLDKYLSVCGTNIKGSFDFNGQLAGSMQDKDGSVTHEFTDKASLRIEAKDITYEEGLTRRYNLRIHKSGSREGDNVLKYRIEVGSAKGTPAEILLTDIWKEENGLLDINKIQNVTVKKQTYELIQKSDGSVNESFGPLENSDIKPDFHPDTNTLNATFPKVDGVEETTSDGIKYTGVQYVIEYEYPVDGIEKEVDYKAINNVNAESAEPGNGEKLSVKTGAEITIFDSSLKKDGNYDANKGVIKWTVTVNESNRNIAGYQLTDDMMTKLEKGKITITPSEGASIVTDATGKKVSAISFAPTGGTENRNKYEITYETPAEKKWQEQIVTNTAVLDPTPETSGDEIEKVATAKIPADGSVDKQFLSAGGDDSIKTLNWKYSIQIPDGGTPADMLVTDTLTNSIKDWNTNPNLDHYMTLAQIKEWAEYVGKKEDSISDASLKWLSKANKDTLQLRKENGEWVPYADVANSADDTKFTGFQFNMKESLTKEDTAEMSYQTSAVVSDKQNGATYYFKNKINTGGKEKEAEYVFSSNINVQKMDGDGKTGSSFTSSEDGLVTWKVKIFMDEDVQTGETIKITDYLPKDSSGKPLVTLETLNFGDENGNFTATIDKSTGALTGELYLGVSVTENSRYDEGEGTVVLEIKRENWCENLNKGNFFWVIYTCRINDKLPEDEDQVYELLNSVSVDKKGEPYGDSEQKQTHTVTVPDKVIKMDGENGTGTTVTESTDGTLVWKVKVNLNKDYSALTITDLLPKDVVLTGISIGEEKTQTQLELGAASDVDGSRVITAPADFGLDLTGSAYYQNGQISLNLKTLGENRPDFFRGHQAVWVTYTCKIKEEKLPDPGTENPDPYILTNHVDVTVSDGGEPFEYGESDQTQKHTVKRPPRVVKMDGNKNASSSASSSQDGIVTWKVKVLLEGDYEKLTVTDHLPVIVNGTNDTSVPAVELVSLTFGGEDVQETAKIEAGTLIAQEGSAFNLEGSVYDADTGEITLVASLMNPENRPVCFSKGNEFWLTYTCKLKELPKMGASAKHTLKNTVDVWKDNDSKKYGTDEQEQEHTVTTPQAKKVDKYGEWVNGSRILEYSVDINEGSQDLLEDKDSLELKDTLTYVPDDCIGDVSLLPKTVTLYYAEKDSETGELVRDEEGHLKPGEVVPQSLWNWVFGTTSEGGKISHSITAQIPDGQALVFKYTYSVSILLKDNPGDKKLDINNNVYLNGVSDAQDSEKRDDKWENAGTSGDVSSDGKYEFYKVDASSYAQLLDGAEFTLYEYRTDETGTGGYVSTGYPYTTKQGKFSVEYNAKDGIGDGYQQFKKNTAYYVVETKAPAGYLLPDEPKKFYFHFSDDSVETSAYPANLGENAAEKFTASGAIDLSKSSHMEFCENTKNATEITVNKKWLNNQGVDVTQDMKTGSVTVDLYRKESEDKPEPTTESMDQEVEVKIDSSSNRLKFCADQTSHKGRVGDTVLVKASWKAEDAGKFEYNKAQIFVDYYTTEHWTRTSLVRASYQENAEELTITAVLEMKLTSEMVQTGVTLVDGNQAQYDWVGEVQIGDGSVPPPPDGGIKQEGKSYPLTADNNWSVHIKDLPLEGVDENNKKVYYTYYVPEPASTIGGCTTWYSNKDGITSGTITVNNQLPDTPPETTSVKVQKKWKLKADGTESGEDSFLSDQEQKKYLTSDAKVSLHLYRTTTQLTLDENGKVRQDDMAALTDCGQVEVSAADNWEHTWTSLPMKDESNSSPYYYYVMEEGTEQCVSVTGNGTTGAEDVTLGSDAGTITVVNELTPTSVTVDKKWFVGETDITSSTVAADHPQTLTVTLYRKRPDNTFEQYGDPVVLNSEAHKGWSYTWENLPQGEYYVQEDTEGVKGFTALYQAENAGTSSDGTKGKTQPAGQKSEDGTQVVVTGGTITIKNTKEVTEIRVKKVWKVGDVTLSEKEVEGLEAKVQLYSSTTPPESETAPPQPSETQTQITLQVTGWGKDGSAPTGGAWIWTKVLPCDQNGNVANYDDSFAVGLGNLETGNAWLRKYSLPGTVTTNGNTEVNYYRIQFGAGGDGNAIASVELTGEGFDRKENGDIVVAGNNAEIQLNLAATLVESGGGTGGDGTPKKIRVEYKDSSSYSEQYADGNVLVEGNVDTDRAIIRIAFGTQWDRDHDGVIPVLLCPDNIGVTKKSKVDASGCYYLDYTIEGLSQVNGDCVLYFQTNGTYPRTGWEVGHSVTAVSSVKIAKAYANNVKTASKMTASAVTDAGLILPSPHTEVGSEITLKSGMTGEGYSSDGWEYIWSNLPKTMSDEAGTPLYYYVKETSTNASFTTSYTYEYIDNNPAKGIQVTITNKLPEIPPPPPEPVVKTTDLTIQKIWEKSNGEPLDVAAGTVKFKLQRRNIAVDAEDESSESTDGNAESNTGGVSTEASEESQWKDYVEESNEEGYYIISNQGVTDVWTMTLKGLPWYETDASGKELYRYVYRVKEILVDSRQYDVTYSGGCDQSEGAGSYTLTITNKKKQSYVLPETGGTGTQPYTLGGILLTSMAALLIGIKNKRRKEEQCSS